MKYVHIGKIKTIKTGEPTVSFLVFGTLLEGHKAAIGTVHATFSVSISFLCVLYIGVNPHGIALQYSK